MHPRLATSARRLLASSLPLLAAAPAAHGFGATGHRIAGFIAEPRLCAAAAREVRALGGGDDLAELGLWADRARGDAAWRHSGPWHYMNIDDGMPLQSYETPPEGDVLSAIDHFSEQLADRSVPSAARAEALRFVVHFVADIHQPLHVGRAQDRGGNRIEVQVDGERLNLHRFWDTEVIVLDGLSAREYARRVVEPLARDGEARWASDAPLVWAKESLELRPVVYGFAAAGADLGQRYRARAGEIIDRRLAQAGVRIAAVLNEMLCEGGSARVP